MTVQVIPLVATPSQTLSVQLSGQRCRINVYTKRTGLYADVLVNDAPIVQGALCLNMTKIVRAGYSGFIGELSFYDTQGTNDPTYDALGNRYVLEYFT